MSGGWRGSGFPSGHLTRFTHFLSGRCGLDRDLCRDPGPTPGETPDFDLSSNPLGPFPHPDQTERPPIPQPFLRDSDAVVLDCKRHVFPQHAQADLGWAAILASLSRWETRISRLSFRIAMAKKPERLPKTTTKSDTKGMPIRHLIPRTAFPPSPIRSERPRRHQAGSVQPCIRHRGHG